MTKGKPLCWAPFVSTVITIGLIPAAFLLVHMLISGLRG